MIKSLKKMYTNKLPEKNQINLIYWILNGLVQTSLALLFISLIKRNVQKECFFHKSMFHQFDFQKSIKIGILNPQIFDTMFRFLYCIKI